MAWFGLFQPQALPKEIRDKMNHRIECGLKQFLAGCQFVGPESIADLPVFERHELVLGRWLGSGGFNTVYEIKSIHSKEEETEERRKHLIDTCCCRGDQQQQQQPRNNKLVMKHIHFHSVQRPSRFKQAAIDLAVEAHILASISHPHVLRIRGTSRFRYKDGRPDGFFLLLDRLEETLEVRMKKWGRQLKRRRQPANNLFADRIDIARDLASGLVYLHDRGVIYRDLKPTNIGFDFLGRVKLFDFGLSREMPSGERGDAFQMSGQIGTQRYISKEVCLGLPYNQTTDVYSLSLVIWEMLALEKPYRGMNQEQHYELVIEGEARPSLSEAWPYGIRALLDGGWAQDWRMRPSMNEFYILLLQEVDELRVNMDMVSEQEQQRSFRGCMEFSSSKEIFMDNNDKSQRHPPPQAKPFPSSIGEESEATEDDSTIASRDSYSVSTPMTPLPPSLATAKTLGAKPVTDESWFHDMENDRSIMPNITEQDDWWSWLGYGTKGNK